MPTILSFLSGRQITNDSGVPQAGAKIHHYRAATTTNLTVWQDAGASVAHAQPVVCDAGGFVPLIYVDDTFDWKTVVTTSADVTLPQYSFDNLPKAETDESAVGFAPPLFPWEQVTSAASPVALTVADVGKAYEADTTGGSIEFDLPDAASVGNGKGFVFKKTAAANTLTIDPSGSQTIDDVSASLAITIKDTVVGIFSNGAEWYTVFEVRKELAVPLVRGLTITNNSGAPTTQIDLNVTSGAMLVDDNGVGLHVASADITINGAATGANGLDSGSLANNTWYHVWLISDGVTAAGLLSTSPSAPTMPSGYTYKVRCGAVRTGGSATFLRTLQKGNTAQYQVVTGSTTPNMPLMASGTAGSVTTPTWVAVATGDFVPPTAVRINGQVLGNSGADYTLMAAPNDDYGDAASTSNPPPATHRSSNGHWGSAPFSFVLESTDIYWASSASNGRLWCYGWVDGLLAS